MAAIIVVLLAIAGYGGYRFYSDRRADAAANLLASAKTSAEFQKVINEYPSTPAGASAYLLLADAQKAEKKFAEANATLQAFLDKYPKHELAGTARLAMAGNLEALGKKDEALATYQRLAASDPKAFTAPVALFSQIHLLKEKNQIEEARKVCETILTQYRESRFAQEATFQLRQLKVKNEPAPSAPPPTAASPVRGESGAHGGSIGRSPAFRMPRSRQGLHRKSRKAGAPVVAGVSPASSRLRPTRPPLQGETKRSD